MSRVTFTEAQKKAAGLVEKDGMLIKADNLTAKNVVKGPNMFAPPSVIKYQDHINSLLAN